MSPHSIKSRIQIIIVAGAMMIALHVVNVLSDGALLRFGLRPGDSSTLLHILSSPWLHGSWGHLLNNLVGFAIFSALCLLRGIRFYLVSSGIIIVLTGILVWLFGRQSTHIGASGWIFGLWSLSIALAWFQRSFMNIGIAIFVAVFYGGMILGVLPSRPHISFESHLFGALSGIFCAYIMTRRGSLKT